MHKKFLAALAALAAAAAPIALATAKSTPHHAKRSHSAETALTGDTKTQAENAAVAANPGATVQHSSSEDPAENTGAAYEVHITKSDGTRAKVLEDSSFTVLSTTADDQPRGGPGGPGNPNEPALTGDEKTKAEAAAIAANPGATAKCSSKEDAAENNGAAYEVHIVKSDGTRAKVLEDSSFTVLSTSADDHGGRGPRH